MNQKNKLVLTQLTEREGKFGKYFTGQLGMQWVKLSKAKNGKWNLAVEERQRDQNQTNAPQQNNDPMSNW